MVPSEFICSGPPKRDLDMLDSPAPTGYVVGGTTYAYPPGYIPPTIGWCGPLGMNCNGRDVHERTTSDVAVISSATATPAVNEVRGLSTYIPSLTRMCLDKDLVKCLLPLPPFDTDKKKRDEFPTIYPTPGQFETYGEPPASVQAVPPHKREAAAQVFTVFAPEGNEKTVTISESVVPRPTSGTVITISVPTGSYGTISMPESRPETSSTTVPSSTSAPTTFSTIIMD